MYAEAIETYKQEPTTGFAAASSGLQEFGHVGKHERMDHELAWRYP
jgi:hypothetical protein